MGLRVAQSGLPDLGGGWMCTGIPQQTGKAWDPDWWKREP